MYTIAQKKDAKVLPEIVVPPVPSKRFAFATAVTQHAMQEVLTASSTGAKGSPKPHNMPKKKDHCHCTTNDRMAKNYAAKS
mmetsp:Transcript_89629/g.172532  ORF Transcript_89629/g.172532 Transcript_89629/m.172532 type:complete len:81 (-) Transcript_89629:14-256(-)